MKILVHPDSVPMSLEECVDNLKTYLDEKDTQEIADFKTNPFIKEKIGAAVFLISAWSLKDDKSRLVQWFKNEYNVTHPDDISGMILHCLYCDVKGIKREEKKLTTKFRKSRKLKETNKELPKVKPEGTKEL